jgi:hypothetical protein
MGDRGGERRSLARRMGKPWLMLVAACSQNEMFAIIRAQACAQVWPMRGRKFQIAVGCGAWDKNDSARARFGEPDYIGFTPAERRVDCEIATPNDARRRRRRSPERLEI